MASTTLTNKLDVTCQGCDARYRVPEEKAGKRVRCRKCRAKIEVPKRDISMRTRNVILDELGITHDDQPAYTPNAAADEVDVAALYGLDHEGPDEDAPSADGSPKKKKKELQSWVRKEDPSKALYKAVGISAVVLLGGLGFARSVLFLGWVGAAVTAAVLAGIAFKVAKDAYAQGDYTPTKETERPATA